MRIRVRLRVAGTEESGGTIQTAVQKVRNVQPSLWSRGHDTTVKKGLYLAETI